MNYALWGNPSKIPSRNPVISRVSDFKWKLLSMADNILKGKNKGKLFPLLSHKSDRNLN